MMQNEFFFPFELLSLNLRELLDEVRKTQKLDYYVTDTAKYVNLRLNSKFFADAFDLPFENTKEYKDSLRIFLHNNWTQVVDQRILAFFIDVKTSKYNDIPKRNPKILPQLKTGDSIIIFILMLDILGFNVVEGDNIL